MKTTSTSNGGNSNQFNSLLDEIKSRLDIETVATELYHVKKSSKGLQGDHAPVHSSKGGVCLTIYQESQSWYCWHCERGGDVLDLLGVSIFGERYEPTGDMFAETLKEASKRTGVTLKPPSKKELELQAQAARLFPLLTDAAQFFNEQLNKCPEMLKFIDDKYGFTPGLIKKRLIGFAPIDSMELPKYLATKGYTEAEMKAASIVNRGGYCRYQGRIMFPYWASGKVVYFAARQTELTPPEKDGRPISKYKKLTTATPDQPQIAEIIRNDNILGIDLLREARKRGYVVVAEGLPDQLAVEMIGEPAISPVTTSFNAAQKEQLAGLCKGLKVYIANDNEVNKAGETGALSTARFLEKAGIPTYLITLPLPDGADKIDACEFIKANGGEAFNALRKKALRLPHYLLQNTQFAEDTEEKADQIEDLAELAYTAKLDALTFSKFQEAVSKRADVDSRIVATIFKAKKAELDQETAEAVETAELDHEAVAQLLVSQSDGNLAFDVDLDIWRKWASTHWQALKERDPLLDGLAIEAIQTVGGTRSTHLVDGAVRFARRLVLDSFPVRAGLVNFKNGTYEAATGKLRAHNREDKLLHCLDYELDTNTRPVETLRFIADAIPDKTARIAFMEHLGLALLGDTRFHKALALLGPSRSGKTTLLKLANMICGQSPEKFADKRIFSSETESLRHLFEWSQRPIACFDELPAEALGLGEEIFKQVAAHSGVTARAMRSQPVSVLWRPKIIFAANDAPRFADKSGALARRLLIISCPKSHTDDELDLYLSDRMTAERGAFARLCIQAALRLMERGKYSVSPEMESHLRQITEESDPVKQFVSERCFLSTKDGRSHYCIKGDLYEAYKKWCNENGLRQHLAHGSLSKRLKQYTPWRLTEYRDNHGQRCWLGIDLKPEGYTDYDDEEYSDGIFQQQPENDSETDADEWDATLNDFEAAAPLNSNIPLTDLTGFDRFPKNLSNASAAPLPSKQVVLTDLTVFPQTKNEKSQPEKDGGLTTISVQTPTGDKSHFRSEKNLSNLSNSQKKDVLPVNGAAERLDRFLGNESKTVKKASRLTYAEAVIQINTATHLDDVLKLEAEVRNSDFTDGQLSSFSREVNQAKARIAGF